MNFGLELPFFAHPDLPNIVQWCSLGEQVKDLGKLQGPMTAEQVGKETTHWLRDTAATDQIDLGIPLDRLSDNLGHSELGTPYKYVLPERRRKMAAIARLWS